MLVIVNVLNDQIVVKTGEKNGKPWKMLEQPNIFHEFKGEVRRVSMILQDGEKPYPPGKYTFDTDQLLTIGRFGYEINRFEPLVLVSIELKESLFKKA